ncbi:sirohydrochlorin chelatase [Luteipulveratus flavus]|uniref:CbiX/SirB N-terminal domain-containing protein n=1 Tax=Luteipulveratus flavus TaxID=3031728 RepID=A0ABT6CEF9_9MICO|nr:CbiX/SirB N-terminal domain-containing protein [Luteipulveratus sp. YIM 133296]MDF8265676.1 CbiX/SirB N-terminal domain-containing protein [Luteipulveratus sp. YIM 133296]
MRPLVLCAHGTADPDGQRTVVDLHAAVRAGYDGRVELAYVDVQQPEPADVVGRVYAEGEAPLIVPLLLSTGYHVRVDIAQVVEAYPGTTAAPALGPGERLARVLRHRLVEAGATQEDQVVLAAAGSSRSEAADDAQEMASLLRAVWGGPVRVAYGSAAQPDVPTAVAQARVQAPGRRVAIAAYLLGRGHFHTQLQRAGADLVTAPLGADPLVVEQVLARAAG